MKHSHTCLHSHNSTYSHSMTLRGIKQAERNDSQDM